MYLRIIIRVFPAAILAGTSLAGGRVAFAGGSSTFQEGIAEQKRLQLGESDATAVGNSAGATFVISPEDVAFESRLRAYVDLGYSRIKSFFGREIPAPFTIHLSPSRKAFTEFFNEKWGISQTQCWWVAAGVADAFIMLSPRVWEKEACEHDAKDAEHIKGLVKHELVHVFHAQHNPKLEELEEIGWFAEGLAAYVSGQLEGRHRGAARKALESNADPKKLAKAWSGPHRYGVSGSLVKYIDVTYGRDVILKMLTVTTQADLLNMIKLTEPQLLDAWRKFVLAGGQD